MLLFVVAGGLLLPLHVSADSGQVTEQEVDFPEAGANTSSEASVQNVQAVQSTYLPLFDYGTCKRKESPSVFGVQMYNDTSSVQPVLLVSAG